MSQHNYTKTDVNVEQITIEIENNTIIVEELDYINFKSSGTDNLKIFFVTDLDAGQITELGNIVTAHTVSTLGEKKYYVAEYNKRKYIIKETWYETDDGNGNYSDKVEEITFDYSKRRKNKNDLLSYTVKNYLKDGTEISTRTFDYYKDINKEIIKEK